jgi:hypothetical protein
LRVHHVEVIGQALVVAEPGACLGTTGGGVLSFCLVPVTLATLRHSIGSTHFQTRHPPSHDRPYQPVVAPRTDDTNSPFSLSTWRLIPCVHEDI